MVIHRQMLILTIGCIFFAAVWAGTAAEQCVSLEPTGVNPEPIEVPTGSAYPTFPTEESILLDLRNRQNTVELRKHAWSVYAGIVRDSSRSGVPVWETWYLKCDVFSNLASDPSCQALRARKDERRGAFFMEVPPELSGLPAGQKTVATTIFFNKEAGRHILDRQLWCQKALCDLNGNLDKLHAPQAERMIPPFPRRSIVVKAIWPDDPVKPGDKIPVWNALWPTTSGETHVPNSWPDSDRLTLENPSIPCQLPPSGNRVSISCFYTIPTGNGYWILLGLHIMTKEVSGWTWSTFWWHPRPDVGRYAAERPDEQVISKGCWRNYLMDTTLSTDTPYEPNPCNWWEGAGCGKKVMFNPYLEAGKKDGIISNCVGCHQKALFKPQGFADQGVTRGKIPLEDSYFSGAVTTDYLWSVSENAYGTLPAFPTMVLFSRNTAPQTSPPSNSRQRRLGGQKAAGR